MSKLPAGPRQQAYLKCTSCGEDSVHDLLYAGRLLHSSHCTNCGYNIRHGEEDFAEKYLRDLEHRLLTKPSRLARHARHEPIQFALGLPRSLLRQPGKLAREVHIVLADVWRRRGLVR